MNEPCLNCKNIHAAYTFVECPCSCHEKTLKERRQLCTKCGVMHVKGEPCPMPQMKFINYEVCKDCGKGCKRDEIHNCTGLLRSSHDIPSPIPEVQEDWELIAADFLLEFDKASGSRFINIEKFRSFIRAEKEKSRAQMKDDCLKIIEETKTLYYTDMPKNALSEVESKIKQLP